MDRSRRQTLRHAAALGALTLCAPWRRLAAAESKADQLARFWAEARPSFFDSYEVRSRNLRPFKKWNGALARYTREQALRDTAGDCHAKTFNACHFRAWTDFLRTLAKDDREAQARKVNAYMNKESYITDPVNWGKQDYWASPGEFIARFGDCEDYAIAKYISLKRIGFTDQDLRVVAVKDQNLRVGHAVMVAFIGGKTWLLDNQVDQMIETKVVRHYEPVFSINGTFWWRHRRKA
ncbi:MAG: transglutaminase-like cysteine peptidase [Hyphomicrobiales bacterium]|nr:transglutaminase-like cysteine peptidase [Hyphomicrobiales bacterium]